jgi:hypothetical protein
MRSRTKRRIVIALPIAGAVLPIAVLYVWLSL